MGPLSTWLKVGRAGWIVFTLGLAWDVVYHTALFLTPSRVTDTVDLIGGLGHVITLIGIVLVTGQLLRHNPK